MSLKKNFVMEYEREYSIKTIGIWGVQKGSGVTHTSLVIAVYMAEVLKKKVAYVEFNSSSEIASLNQNVLCHSNAFNYRGIHFYPNISREQLWNLMGAKFEILVIDCGASSKFPPKEFELFQKKLVVLDSAPWRQKLNDEWFYSIGGKKKDYQYVIPCEKEQIMEQISRQYGCGIDCNPYQKDTFQLNLSMIHALHILLSN